MSDFYNKYPYTDFHELNLDWVIERVKKLTEDWAATLEEWNSTEEQWQELYDYVHDYFDNLDVQQEINNKINTMIADGTFVTITTPVIEAKVASMMPATVASQIGDTVASQIGATVASQIGDTVASQIDAAVVTPVDTWLSQHITQPTTPVVDTSLTIAGAAADAKTVGDLFAGTYNSSYRYHVNDYVKYNGLFYRCIYPIITPEAWTAAHWVQVDIGSELTRSDNMEDLQMEYASGYLLTKGKNLINSDHMTDGWISDGQGTISALPTYKTTELIPVKAGVDVTISPRARISLFYDQNLVPDPSRYDNTTINTGLPFTYIPPADGYVRFTVFTSDEDFWQAEYASSETMQEPFELNLAEPVKIPKVENALHDSPNLINTSVLSDGWLDSTDNIVSSLLYKTTDYIPIRAGQKITISPKARIMAAYSISKIMLPGGYDNTNINTGSPYTFTASENGYVRFTIWTDDAGSWQAEYGDTATDYVPYDEYDLQNVNIKGLNDLADYVDAIDTRLTNTNNKLNNAIADSINLIDPNAVVNGFIADATGAITADANYVTTDYLPIAANQKITISPRARVMLLYDTAQTPVPGTFNNSTINTGQPFTYQSSVDGFIRFSIWIADNANWQAEYGDTPSPVQPYGYHATKVFYTDKLLSKKWAVCGDSFTDGVAATTFDDYPCKGKRKVYPYYIQRRTGIEILKFFASGRCLGYPSDQSISNSLTNPTNPEYYQNIPADVDYITIYLGINDSHNESIIPIGTINDATTETYYGAWNVVLTWLKTNRPFAHIGIIVSNGCDRMAYRTAQIDVAKKYGIAYIDLNGDQTTPAMIRPQNDDIPASIKTIMAQNQAVSYPDNQHPNDDAHEFESWFIEDFLRRI